MGHVVGVGHGAVVGEGEGGGIALLGAEEVRVDGRVVGLVVAEIVDFGAGGEVYLAVAEAQAGVIGPGLAVAGDGDEQVGQDVADVAGQDEGQALVAFVEHFPGLALALVVDDPVLDGDLGPVVPGDDAVNLVAVVVDGLALRDVFQEGVVVQIAALVQERVERCTVGGAAQKPMLNGIFLSPSGV